MKKRVDVIDSALGCTSQKVRPFESITFKGSIALLRCCSNDEENRLEHINFWKKNILRKPSPEAFSGP